MSAPTRMTEHVQAYLSLRRAFGFDPSITGANVSRLLHVSPIAKLLENPSRSSWPFGGRSCRQPGSRSVLHDGC